MCVVSCAPTVQQTLPVDKDGCLPELFKATACSLLVFVGVLVGGELLLPGDQTGPWLDYFVQEHARWTEGRRTTADVPSHPTELGGAEALPAEGLSSEEDLVASAPTEVAVTELAWRSFATELQVVVGGRHAVTSWPSADVCVPDDAVAESFTQPPLLRLSAEQFVASSSPEAMVLVDSLTVELSQVLRTQLGLPEAHANALSLRPRLLPLTDSLRQAAVSEHLRRAGESGCPTVPLSSLHRAAALWDDSAEPLHVKAAAPDDPWVSLVAVNDHARQFDGEREAEIRRLDYAEDKLLLMVSLLVNTETQQLWVSSVMALYFQPVDKHASGAPSLSVRGVFVEYPLPDAWVTPAASP